MPLDKHIIYIKLTFPIKDPKNFKIETNAKPELVGSLIGDFLHTQHSQDADDRDDTEREIYHIDLSVDLADDTWRIEYDTGNKGLRNGILMHVFQVIERRKGVIDWLFRPLDEKQGCENKPSKSSSLMSEPPTSSG